ncbi:acyl transferase/acyl hydrolase/lysophospholipase [Microdochium trichocladiopsis]|uniref:Lysophospholipase n=1 Tax=Microdochium trichocladiopsis TaxID=1682393 RepID=A0A9P9BJA4_9PEZI|nr:acyl transferase/acyl hydrolase/lysophospholipase [Microdochium trichocladiopsis]KAH7017943.1 acyl transferase/acyl hydrolase/lysophospholipase [Microdochium trichocladiopsis]
MGISESDRVFLRQCVALAREALEAGDDAFGSVLVDGAGKVRYTDRNRTRTKQDVTWHPEFTIVVSAQTHMTPEERAAATVYTSGEHCQMCSTAHGYAGLGRIVFASSSGQFAQWLAELGVVERRVRSIPIRDVVPGLTVDGPDDETAAEVYKLHQARYGKLKVPFGPSYGETAPAIDLRKRRRDALEHGRWYICDARRPLLARLLVLLLLLEICSASSTGLVVVTIVTVIVVYRSHSPISSIMVVAKPILGAVAAAGLLSGISSSTVAAAEVARGVGAAELSPNETEWLRTRRNNTIEPMTAFLKRVNISGFDVDSFIRSASNDASVLPNIAIAASGGGYRALMNGAGFIAAADSRVAGANSTGGIGGLLQSATYLAGRSAAGRQLEHRAVAFDRSILVGPSAGALSEVEYWKGIYDSVEAKEAAGFNTSITDYWGRTLSFQLVNDTSGADERSPGTTAVSSNSTVFEFNPWELGSWDPTVYGFTPLEYLGSNFTNSTVSNATSQQCVRGFDQYGFVMGTSSSLFNELLLQNLSSRVPGGAQLVDGGEDLQNIPLDPLIQPARAVDVIFATDSSADINNWPNATALRATYVRSLTSIANGTQFPRIPSAETFINLGLNRRPTAFGYNAGIVTSNGTTNSGSSTVTGPVRYPLIVYVPNTPYTALSNVLTFQMSYDAATRNDIIQNGYNVATIGNGTIDSSWPTCVGCFVLQRSLVRSGAAIPTACQACYRRFCYNGTVDDTPVTAYNPIPFLQLTGSSTTGSSPSSAGTGPGASHTNGAVRATGTYSGAAAAFLLSVSALVALM